MLTYKSFPTEDQFTGETELDPEEKIRFVLVNIHHTQYGAAVDAVQATFGIQKDSRTQSFVITRNDLVKLVRLVGAKCVLII